MRADIAFAVLDVFIIIAAYTIGLALRMLDPMVGDGYHFWVDLGKAIPIIVVVHLLANLVAGAYGHVWEHASTDEAIQVSGANVAAGAMILGLGWLARDQFGIVIPYAVLVVGAFLSLAGMGLVRFRTRLFSFHRTGGGPRVLIVGTTHEAATFARQISQLPGGGRVVGFMADFRDLESSVRRLAGLPIFGSIEDTPDVVRQQEIDEVVVVGGDASRARKVVDLCLDVDARLRILPGAQEIMLSSKSALDVRDIRFEDLLSRPEVATDLDEVAGLLRGRRILVTGAGGSIGSEVVNQVLGFDPAGVWALDRDETLLHDAGLRWRGRAHTLLCDLREAEKLLWILEEVRPDVVFHAAALKHVPMLEAFPEEAVLTNVVGTRNLIEAASRNGVSQFVLISTDKAVDPSSVMGATKRIAEMMVQVGHERNDGCVYTAVRFGNVLGSRGSVIPTFIDQIESGGPVTVTDAEMTRYFMTVDEAVELVLQASALAGGSEVFFLDMGEPVRIVEMARRLIRLAGLTPERDIPIIYTGRRPGEKLSESLSNGELDLTRNPKIFEARLDNPSAYTVMEAIADLEGAARAVDRSQVKQLLGTLAGGMLSTGGGEAAGDSFELTWS